MKIADGIHVVMSGALGFDLTDRYDCTVFLIRSGSEWLLFDAGAGRAVDDALAIAAGDGIDLGAIRHLFLTHAHADHSGGAGVLREALGVTVHASREATEMMAAGDERGISLDVAKRAGIYPPTTSTARAGSIGSPAMATPSGWARPSSKPLPARATAPTTSAIS